MNLRQWDNYFRNMAVYAYFDGASRLPEPDAANNIFIESYEHGWTWNIPLADHTASVGIVVDSELGQRGISQARRERLLHQAATLGKPHIPHDRRRPHDQPLPESSRTGHTHPSSMIGDGWILVGDAACFIDPLFSSGVHLAMMSAVMATAYIRAIHADPSMRQSAARLYQQLYRKEYGHFRELARLFYASNRTVDSYFWEARRIIGDDDQEARRSFIRAVAGQAPRGYERAVLDKGHLPPDLTDTIHQIESGRLQRAAKPSTAYPIHDAIPRLAPGTRLERGLTFAGDSIPVEPPPHNPRPTRRRAGQSASRRPHLLYRRPADRLAQILERHLTDGHRVG